MSQANPYPATAAASAAADNEPIRETFALDFTVQRALAANPIGSPCTNVCKLDTSTRTFCIGCKRTRVEIKAWKTMSDTEKRFVIEDLLQRA